jgi:hypothetical protein
MVDTLDGKSCQIADFCEVLTLSCRWEKRFSFALLLVPVMAIAARQIKRAIAGKPHEKFKYLNKGCLATRVARLFIIEV